MWWTNKNVNKQCSILSVVGVQFDKNRYFAPFRNWVQAQHEMFLLSSLLFSAFEISALLRMCGYEHAPKMKHYSCKWKNVKTTSDRQKHVLKLRWKLYYSTLRKNIVIVVQLNASAKSINICQLCRACLDDQYFNRQLKKTKWINTRAIKRHTLFVFSYFVIFSVKNCRFWVWDVCVCFFLFFYDCSTLLIRHQHTNHHRTTDTHPDMHPRYTYIDEWAVWRVELNNKTDSTVYFVRMSNYIRISYLFLSL